ncbi:DUF7660 family protein [Promicromonospora soli]|nr:hypothetical protein [Promicromonospora soli]
MELMCRRSHRPVRVSAAQFDVFEQMHYVCFHYEFEHDAFDVDEECSAGGCPSATIATGRGIVIGTARALAIESASDAPWANPTVHEYLEAFARWLEDSDGYYINQGRVPPGSGWEVVNDGLRAATTYE